MSLPDANATAADAFRHEELGLYAQALEGYRKALEIAPDHFYAATRSLLLQRYLKPGPPTTIKILWQIDVEKCWETEWVRFLLSACTDGEIIDGQHRIFEDGCVVVDRYLFRERPAYYFELLKRGCRFALFHTSDEHYWEDCTPYSFANFVFRNYWSRMHAQSHNVATMPLGLVRGFRASAGKSSAERKYLWCFVGNPGKRSRLEMLQGAIWLGPRLSLRHQCGQSDEAYGGRTHRPAPAHADCGLCSCLIGCNFRTLPRRMGKSRFLSCLRGAGSRMHSDRRAPALL